MSLILKIVCPSGIVTASDTREVFSTVDINGNKRAIGHIEGVAKSFLKNKLSIAIAGNANIGEKQLKDFFPRFLDSLNDDISCDSLLDKISGLYYGLSRHSTTYLVSFYSAISSDSKYKKAFKFEPVVFRLETDTMTRRRTNVDEDGFTYGFFWAGENNLISKILMEKERKLDANEYSINSSIEVTKSLFNEISIEFEKNKEYSTVSKGFDLTIQTPNGSTLKRNYT